MRSFAGLLTDGSGLISCVWWVDIDKHYEAHLPQARNRLMAATEAAQVLQGTRAGICLCTGIAKNVRPLMSASGTH